MLRHRQTVQEAALSTVGSLTADQVCQGGRKWEEQFGWGGGQYMNTHRTSSSVTVRHWDRWRVPSVIFGPQANQACQHCSLESHRQTWSDTQPGNRRTVPRWWGLTGSEASRLYPASHPLPRLERLSLWGRGTSGGPTADPRLGRACPKMAEMSSYCPIYQRTIHCQA